MTASFECEVRYLIKDITIFRKRMKQIGAIKHRDYSFIDYYYQPIEGKWNPLEKILRIRSEQPNKKNPSRTPAILFTKNEIISLGGISFKRSIYEEGKVQLYEGPLNICKSILEEIGFKQWIIVNKQEAHFWKCPKINNTVSEYIPNYGWSGELEFEGLDIKKAKEQIEKALKILDIPQELVSYKPLSLLYAEKNNLL
jgi:adenylate cyclase class IV